MMISSDTMHLDDVSHSPQKYFRSKPEKLAAAVILSIFTLGIYPLICVFKKIWWVKIAYEQCNPNECSVVVIQDEQLGREGVFCVEYYSSDGLRLTPLTDGCLTASPYIHLRIDIGDGQYLQYDADRDRFDIFVVVVPTTISSDDNKIRNNYVSIATRVGEQADISEQLERGVSWLNKNTDDENELVGFKKVRWRVVLLYIEYVLSLGIFWLFCYWQPYLTVLLTHRRSNLLSADTILVMATPTSKTAEIKVYKSAAEIIPDWLDSCFSSGALIIVSLLTPIGILVLLIIVVYLYAVLRPYSVCEVNHSTRDNQQVSLAEASASTVDYFKWTCCSESGVVKFFYWQKIKYVWSGVAVVDDVCLPAFRFERQRGLVAQEDVDPQSPTTLLSFKHQLLGVAPTMAYLRSCYNGLSDEKVTFASGLLGKNKIDLPLTPLFIVFLQQVITPFYIFQAAAVVVWILEYYYTYSIIIVVLSLFAAIWQIVVIRMEEIAVRKTLHISSPVEIIRQADAGPFVIDPEDLVLGDVTIIPPNGCILQSDVVLLSGSCLVDESMLTGESVPVFKFALSPPSAGSDAQEVLQSRKNERNILYCGTRVLQANSQGSPDGRVRAVVVRTGFMTAKGELTRLILYPKPFDFQFAADAVKFVAVMAAVGVIGAIDFAIVLPYFGVDPNMVALRSLAMITVAVPPALPIALSIGYLTAVRRLERLQVYCTSPSLVNLAGCVDVVCMDKTGTMTEDGLDFKKLLPAYGGRFADDEEETIPTSQPDSDLIRCLVTCHSLVIVDGKAVGDPIEEKMFELTRWTMEDSAMAGVYRYGPTGEVFHPMTTVRPPQPQASTVSPIGVIRQLPFSSHFQRMSVVACSLGQPSQQIEPMMLYMKGAPETVVRICRPNTVPVNVRTHLDELTQCGYRVLGLACRVLTSLNGVAEVLSLERDELEQDLTFLGLLIFENKLKPESFDVIGKLKKARIRLIMLTGDNPLTAVSVARQAGMIDDSDKVFEIQATAPSAEKNGLPRLEYVELTPYTSSPVISTRQHPQVASVSNEGLVILPSTKLVVSGSSWAVVKQFYPEEIDRILAQGTVFARVNPNQKKEVVEGLQQRLGHYALMCGDGANDCGALRAACTGISLSKAEASVASPFTSKVENISCVHVLIREGRCSIVTSFAAFRFMFLYSLIESTSVLILNNFGDDLPDNSYLYTDLFLATILSITMSFTEAYDHIVPEKPPSSLLETRMLLSLILQSILIIGFQLLTYLYCVYGDQFWFLPYIPPPNGTDSYQSFESYCLIVISIFQYPCAAFVLSKGIPYRKPFFTNIAFVVNLVVVYGVNIFLTFDPEEPFPADVQQVLSYSSIGELIGMQVPPSMGFRAVLFLFASIYTFTSLIVEIVFIEHSWVRDFFQNMYRKVAQKVTTSRKAKYDSLN